MSSYLNIYLQKKKKEGEEQGERLLLCSISSANNIYSLFYDNSIGNTAEDGMHEFTSDDFDQLINDLKDRMSKVLIVIASNKDALPLISNKDSIADTIEMIQSDKDYYQSLLSDMAYLMALGTLFADVSESWCDFDKLYWKIT